MPANSDSRGNEGSRLHLHWLTLVSPGGSDLIVVVAMAALEREALRATVAAHVESRFALPPDWSARRQIQICDEPLDAYDTRDATFYAVKMREEMASPDLLEGLAQQGQVIVYATPADPGN